MIRTTGVVVRRGDTEPIEAIVDALLAEVKEAKDVPAWLKRIEEARAAR